MNEILKTPLGLIDEVRITKGVLKKLSIYKAIKNIKANAYFDVDGHTVMIRGGKRLIYLQEGQRYLIRFRIKSIYNDRGKDVIYANFFKVEGLA